MSATAIPYIGSRSDEDLMQLVQNGNEAAYTELVIRYQERLHHFLYRYTRDHQDCEDLVQETFLRVYKSCDSYKPVARFSTWMYTIGINLAKSLYKKKNRMYTVDLYQESDNGEEYKLQVEDDCILQDQELHEKWSVKMVQKALDELPEEFREVVILRDIEQLSYEEISEKVGVPMGTVKSRINRGRSQIAEQVAGYADLGTSFR